MLKFFILIACCLLSWFNSAEARDKDAFKAQLTDLAKQCLNEIGASDADIADIANNIPAAGMEGQCLHACVMKAIGLMDSKGKLDKTFALEFAKQCADGDAELLKKGTTLIENCAAIEVSDNECEAVEQYKNCVREQAKVLNIADMEF